MARWACVLRSCSEFKFYLVCLDSNGAQLQRTEALSYADEMSVLIALREPSHAPAVDDWSELSRRMVESQTVRLGAIAVELATLAPKHIFAGWSVTRRLGVLSKLEQALLDPTNAKPRPCALDSPCLSSRPDAPC